MNARRTLLAALLLAGMGAGLACSPEAGRVRGGGPGADVGNRGSSVELHGQRGAQQIYFQTPKVGQGVQR